MSSTIDEQAKLAAARVNGQAVGFDPITIITILTTLLPILIKCFQGGGASTPAETAAAVRDQHDKHPEQLRRRTARRIRGEADEPMSKAASFALADAVIAQAMEADAETTAACCAEAALDA